MRFNRNTHNRRAVKLRKPAVQKVYGLKNLLREEAGKRLLVKKDLQVLDWEEMEAEVIHRYGPLPWTIQIKPGIS